MDLLARNNRETDATNESRIGMGDVGTKVDSDKTSRLYDFVKPFKETLSPRA
jgi:hypothetical protein